MSDLQMVLSNLKGSPNPNPWVENLSMFCTTGGIVKTNILKLYSEGDVAWVGGRGLHLEFRVVFF